MRKYTIPKFRERKLFLINIMTNIKLKKGKEKPARQHHCWIFSGAIDKISGKPTDGEIVEVNDYEGNFLAYGYYNSLSKISVRLLEWNKNNSVNDKWWEEKINAALERRKELFKSEHTDSFRLIYSEADLLPGLIVDKYSDYLVCQFLTSGVDVNKHLITQILNDLVKPSGIYERSDATVRKLDGMGISNQLLIGKEPPEFIEIRENGILFSVSITEGQKSGYFLDQRENRKKLTEYVNGKDVLDCFCYSGGFSLYAVKANAKSVTSVDSSAPAIKTVEENYKINKLSYQNENLIEADVFDFLRKAQQDKKHWEVIILDPPKLAPTRQAIDRAQRAYKDLNMQALKLMKQGDLLATFSCSGGISLELFKQIIAWAAMDAGKEIQFIDQFNQPSDHPVRASFPESEYLKGVLCRVI
jgi:23S rRNA (cytosine1962-C5)-methyltransferase